MLNRLLRDHALLRARGETLLGLLDLPEPPDPAVLADARWQLTSQIMQHLSLEDRHLFGKLLADPREEVRALGNRFQAELADLFTHHAEHARTWTPERIAADWQTFRSASRHRVLEMFARLDREEEELYPLAREAKIDVDSYGPHSFNWTRDAFAIKDSITLGAVQGGD
ncbi:hypothetical protein C7451_10651 [Blastomonas natatoria]|uniref:Hemerythrin HHE cation binding domain-containing protein n=1 Tax=Blastomonas natatoria TaxID=34015 RepID=A0A2V3V2V5_9SPHN|nr:hypothetical protein [Blastomonas natatoria]PXW75890.1 hypothetical protein C7451_10651 [Blastomonas natatoria]